MTTLLSGLRTAAIAALVLLGGAGVASSVTPWLPLPAVDDASGHRSSLRAMLTMSDGSTRAVTIQGAGCTANICSRVRALDVLSESVWLDSVDSVSQISREPDGVVTAIFEFWDGRERQHSIVQGNRILYIRERFGRVEKLDLASITRIDFERSSTRSPRLSDNHCSFRSEPHRL
jgi:hypothetical protein